MPRKRKVSENVEVSAKTKAVEMSSKDQAMIKLLLNTQKGESQYKKSTTELQKIFEGMEFDHFMSNFFRIIFYVMHRDETDTGATNVLKFCSQFIAQYGDESDTHPIIKYSFQKLLSVTSPQAIFRMRLCQFIMLVMNAFSANTEIDDEIYELIIAAMIDFIKDVSPVVRVQAVHALQRLQNPEDQDDIVIKSYIHHLNFDPSPKVRQAVMSAIAKKIQFVSTIIERLYDTDEKVRRHTYLQMSSFPVKTYRITDRLTMLECGLYDRSETVRKAVCSIMLPNWIAAYEKKYDQFVAAIKLDSREEDLQRSKKIAHDALQEIFKRQSIHELITFLNFQEDSDFKCCIPFNNITLESLIVWKAVILYFENYTAKHGRHSNGIELGDDEDLDESVKNYQDILDNGEILPELSVMCKFIDKYITEIDYDKNDKFLMLNFNHCLLTLLEIVKFYDFHDEIGRNNLKALLRKILVEYQLIESVVQAAVEIYEQLILDVNDRLNFLHEVVNEIISTNRMSEMSIISYADEIIKESTDNVLKLKVSELKLKIMDCVESENSNVEKKDYTAAQLSSEQASQYNEELLTLLRNFTEDRNSTVETTVSQLETFKSKKLTQSDIVKSLQIIFYMVVSKGVKALTHDVLGLHKEFIARHQESMDAHIRIWALKSATACSMLYETIAKDVFNALRVQLFKTTMSNVWSVSIECIFELIDRYGFEFLGTETDTEKNGMLNGSKSKKSGRALYNSNVDDEEEDEEDMVNSFPIMNMMFHIMDTCQDLKIHKVLLTGICRIILHGHYMTKEVISKLLLIYFNPATESEINQLLGVFFENIVKNKQQEGLQQALMKTIVTLLKAPHDSPLKEVKVENILRYVIESTRPIYCSTGLNLHNDIALSFLEMINDNLDNKDVIKLFSKDLLILEISEDDVVLKTNLKNLANTIIQEYDTTDPKIIKNLKSFKEIMEGTYRPPLAFSSTANNFANGEHDPDQDNEQNSDSEVMSAVTNDELAAIDNPKTPEESHEVQSHVDVRQEAIPEEEEDSDKETNGDKSDAETNGKESEDGQEHAEETQNTTIIETNTVDLEPVELPLSPGKEVEIPASQEDIEEIPATQNPVEIPATQQIEDVEEEEEIPASPAVENVSRYRRTKRQLPDSTPSSGASSPKVKSPQRKQMKVSTPSRIDSARGARGNVASVSNTPQRSMRGKQLATEKDKTVKEVSDESKRSTRGLQVPAPTPKTPARMARKNQVESVSEKVSDKTRNSENGQDLSSITSRRTGRSRNPVSETPKTPSSRLNRDSAIPSTLKTPQRSRRGKLVADSVQKSAEKSSEAESSEDEVSQSSGQSKKSVSEPPRSRVNRGSATPSTSKTPQRSGRGRPVADSAKKSAEKSTEEESSEDEVPQRTGRGEPSNKETTVAKTPQRSGRTKNQVSEAPKTPRSRSNRGTATPSTLKTPQRSGRGRQVANPEKKSAEKSSEAESSEDEASQSSGRSKNPASEASKTPRSRSIRGGAPPSISKTPQRSGRGRQVANPEKKSAEKSTEEESSEDESPQSSSQEKQVASSAKKPAGTASGRDKSKDTAPESSNTRSTRGKKNPLPAALQKSPEKPKSKPNSPVKQNSAASTSKTVEPVVRTRHQAIEETVKAKVLTRKSLNALSAKSPVRSRLNLASNSAQRLTRSRPITK